MTRTQMALGNITSPAVQPSDAATSPRQFLLRDNKTSILAQKLVTYLASKLPS
jgi:hypothetical protein